MSPGAIAHSTRPSGWRAGSTVFQYRDFAGCVHRFPGAKYPFEALNCNGRSSQNPAIPAQTCLAAAVGSELPAGKPEAGSQLGVRISEPKYRRLKLPAVLSDVTL
jgi:hypothetical protein